MDALQLFRDYEATILERKKNKKYISVCTKNEETGPKAKILYS